MFSNIIVIVCILFFVANGAKYRVLDQNLRKLSKEQKIEAIKKVKAHIQSFKSNDLNVRARKELEGVKNLKGWNTYDTTFDSKKWFNYEMYTTADCTGGVVVQRNEYPSVCYTGTFEGGDETYSSFQSLFTSDCSQQTLAFYTTADCSGTPAQQGNTIPVATSTTCQNFGDDDDDSNIQLLTYTSSCTASASAWTGGDAVQIESYVQTSTCNNDLLSGIGYIKGGCYPIDDESIKYSSGPAMSLYDTADCTGSSVVIYPAACDKDDDDGGVDDDLFDDGLFDDGMFTYTDLNEETSTAFAWNASSMGAVLNYSLSAALVLVSCTLFF